MSLRWPSAGGATAKTAGHDGACFDRHGAAGSEPVECGPCLVNPTVRIALRWAFIGVLTLIAFWPSLVSLAGATRSGGLGGYIWMVPVAAILAAQGVARRNRTELPIHDRQTDVIVGTMGLVFALLLHGVLLQRYALYFHLLRLDLVAMWMFVLSVSDRAVRTAARSIRFAWVWAAVCSWCSRCRTTFSWSCLGGNKMAAGIGTMVIAGAATGIAVGSTSRRGWIGGARRVGRRPADPRGDGRSSSPMRPCCALQLLPSLTATAWSAW